MKKHMQNRLGALALTIGLFSILTLQPPTARAQNTAFIYQDQVDQGLPSDLLEGAHKIGDGDYTFSFSLATAASGSNYIGDAITNKVIIADKQFSTTLDFGNLFDGAPRWVEIARKVGAHFVILTPRQLLPSAPYALYAYTAGTIAASNITGGSITINAGNGLSGGGTVALDGSTTINNTGVLSVTGSGSIIAATVDGAVTISDNATNGNIASTIVERDSSGNFSANSVTLNGLNLPDPGAIYSGDNAVLYSDGSTGNFFAGLSAGNPSNGGGTDNTANGYQALYNNGIIVNNGPPIEEGNIGNDNTASGYQALYANGSITNNGGPIFGPVNIGNDNTAYGYQALYANGGVSNNFPGIIEFMVAGNYNTACGYQALYNNGSVNNGSPFVNAGNNNIALGYQAGTNIISGSYNIDIGTSGTSDENGIIRIGIPDVQTATYLAGTVYANGAELSSDRNAKEQFAPVNAQAVLDKVAALPITQWKFKTDKGVQHIGPMAQDFKAAFNLGTDDKHIAVVDEGGVALAAIQGLNQKLNEKNAEIQELKQSVEELKKLVQSLAGKK
jgi:trimeric autotransporter adhesin